MKVEVGALYEHFKGKRYKVLAVAHHSEDLQPYVVYEALYHSEQFGDHSLWVRPLAMFVEEVEMNGKKVPRFQKIIIQK